MVKRLHTLAMRALVVPRVKLLPPRTQNYGSVTPLPNYNEKIQELEQTIHSLKLSIATLSRFQDSLVDDGR